jgi:ABC-type lipoprotein release transport system permease subunit
VYLTLSWRNVWRNKKRTVIAAASVFFAVLLAVITRSAQQGSYAYMIHSAAKGYTGFLQVQGKGYWENRSLDQSILISNRDRSLLFSIPHVTSLTPRLETVALVSSDAAVTRAAQIIGIDPQAENAMTGLKKRVVRGAFLDENPGGVLIAQGLAATLKAAVGDSLVVYGQGFHGQIAAVRLPVAGIVRLPVPEMNDNFVYLSLPEAQAAFSAEDRITSLAIMIDAVGNMPAVRGNVRTALGGRFAVMTWDEMMPDLAQTIQLDNASGAIMLVILYIVVAFGVFGTVMMMTSERLREFGILVSLGMQKTSLMRVTVLETVSISLLGVIAGMLGSAAAVAYLHAHPLPITGDAAKAFETIGVQPVLNFSADPHIFLNQAAVVLVVALLSAVYPVLFINRLEPVRAIHG